MSEAELLTSIREVLLNTFQERDQDIDIYNVDMDTDLIEQLSINSILVIEILVRLENILDIEFDDENLSPENIRTMRSIVSFCNEAISKRDTWKVFVIN